jgi:hypothetical protein
VRTEFREKFVLFETKAAPINGRYNKEGEAVSGARKEERMVRALVFFILIQLFTRDFRYEELEEEVCSVCPAMTYQQRLIGCASCMAIGFLLSMGSLFRSVFLFPFAD